MNSSQTARVALFALWVIATLLLSSAQRRVLASASSRRVRYLVAWLVCTLVLGWLLLAMDAITGRGDMPRRAADIAFAAVVAAAGLAAGRGSARLATLLLIHGLVVFLLGYVFI